MDVSVLTRADHEAANIRRGVDFALRSGEADLASLLFYGLWVWMVVRGSLTEARGHVRTYLELDLESVDPQTRFAGYFGVGEILRHHGEREEAIRIKLRMLETFPQSAIGRSSDGTSDPWNRRCSPTWPTWSSTSASSAPHSRMPSRRSRSANRTVIRRESPTHSTRSSRSPRRGATSPRRRALQERVVRLMRDSQLVPAETVQEELALAELEVLCDEPSLARRRLAAVDVAEIVRVGDLPAAAEALRIFATCMASSGDLEGAAFLIGAYERLHRETGVSTLLQVTARVEALVGDLRRQLGDERFDRIAATGAASSAMELVSELPTRLTARTRTRRRARFRCCTCHETSGVRTIAPTYGVPTGEGEIR